MQKKCKARILDDAHLRAHKGRYKMIFMFWTGSMLSEPPASAAWHEKFPSKFRIFGDSDVIPLLRRDDYIDIYNKIRIPACKSDIARLVLLKEYGGVYVDGHTAPGSYASIAAAILNLAKYELILFSEGWKDSFSTYGNTFMIARKDADILDKLIIQAFCNLFKHKAKEDLDSKHIPYDIFRFTGTPIIYDCIFDRDDPDANKPNWNVKPSLRGKVLIQTKVTKEDDIGFWPWVFYKYRSIGQHWTEIQQRERLFYTDQELYERDAHHGDT